MPRADAIRRRPPLSKTQAIIVAAAFVPLGIVGVVAIHIGRGALMAERYHERFAVLEKECDLPGEGELARAGTQEAEQLRNEFARVHQTLKTVIADLERGSVSEELWLDDQEWGKEHLQRVRYWLSKRREFYRAVEALASSPVARRAADSGQRVLPQAPRERELEEAVHLLVARARVYARDREHERAARCFAQGFVLLKLSHDGTLASARLGMGLRNRLWTEAARMSEADLLEPRALLEFLGPQLERSFDPAEVDRILRAELAALRDVEPPKPCLSEPMSFIECTRDTERMLASLEARERCLDLVSIPGEEFETVRETLLEELPEDDPLFVAQNVDFVTTARLENSRQALFRIVLAARAYHAAEQDWPESLDLLRPFLEGEVPADPFTGEPFGYEERDGGWLLGPAGGSHGGNLDQLRQSYEAYSLR